MSCVSRLKLIIDVGARSSPLSRCQVQEVYQEILPFHPHLSFRVHWMVTTGDRDQKTSLREMEKTNFFTKEIDEFVQEKVGRVGIHSAKDLPECIPEGLSIFCITKGVDSSDSLVIAEKESLETLKPSALIATSSQRREMAVKELRADFCFCDIRGTIEERLKKLETGEVQGVVIAEAALIRLGLTHLNRIRLSATTVEGQGRLAVVGNERDDELRKLFACLDSRLESAAFSPMGKSRSC